MIRSIGKISLESIKLTARQGRAIPLVLAARERRGTLFTPFTCLPLAGFLREMPMNGIKNLSRLRLITHDAHPNRHFRRFAAKRLDFDPHITSIGSL